MNSKVLIGSAIAVALMGVGVLAGSVVGAGSVAAQTPSATAQATAVPSQPGTTAPPVEGFRGRGHGHGGLGPGGRGATADNASQQITNTTSLITLVKSDLAYATGKMDTADLQRWISGAESLLTKAQSANSASNYGQAVAYAHAARELAMTARMQMAQELGAENLPSYSQLPQRGDKGLPADATVTQAQASWVLAETYNRIVVQGTLVDSASNASEARPYLTDAQNAYHAAYDAYQAGNYADAVESARLAGKFSSVAGSIVQAPAAPRNADTPVTVPAPNF